MKRGKRDPRLLSRDHPAALSRDAGAAARRRWCSASRRRSSTPTSLLRNWRAFEKLGVSHLYTPSGYYALMFLDFPVTLGAYHGRRSRQPSRSCCTWCACPARQGGRGATSIVPGAAELLQTTFETFERRTRDLLARRARTAADSTRPRTFWASRSIAGRTGMPTSVTR